MIRFIQWRAYRVRLFPLPVQTWTAHCIITIKPSKNESQVGEHFATRLLCCLNVTESCFGQVLMRGSRQSAAQSCRYDDKKSPSFAIASLSTERRGR